MKSLFSCFRSSRHGRNLRCKATTRRCSFESLEARRPMAFGVGSFNIGFIGPVLPADHETPAYAEVNNLSVPSVNVEANAEVIMAKVGIRDLPGGPRMHRLDSIIFIEAIDSASLDENVWDFSLYGDLNGKVSDGFETWLADAEPYEGVVEFYGFDRPVFVGGTRKPTFQVVAHTVEAVGGGEFLGIEIAEVGMSSLQGWWYEAEDVQYTGALPTLHPLIETVTPTLVVTMQDIGATGVAKAGTQVTLLRFVAEVDEGSAWISKLWFSSDTGFQNLTKPELWWDSNGDQTVDTVISTGITYGIFLDFVGLNRDINDGETHTFEVRASVISNPNTNLTFALEFDQVFGGWEGQQPLTIVETFLPPKRFTFTK